MESDQVLHMHWCWPVLGSDCYLPIFANLQQSYGAGLSSKFCVRSISWKQIDGIWPSFAYSLMLTWCRLKLVYIIFCKFTIELQLMVIVKISFPLNVLWTNKWNLIKFCTHALTLTRSSFWLLCVNFRIFTRKLWPLIVSAQYLENKFLELNQILHMHWH